MTAAPPPSLARSVAAALDWWREAGVTQAFLDEPQTWLAPREGESPRPPCPLSPRRPNPKPPPERFGGDAQGWPQTLADFAPWWLAEPTLDGGIVQGRVPRAARPMRA
jgi:DNA polymerase